MINILLGTLIVKYRLAVGALFAVVSVAAIANIVPEFIWPVANVSQLLTAIGSQNAEMLNRVIAPDAAYYDDYVAEERKQSTHLGLASFGKIAAHCSVTAIHPCSPTAASVDWVCGDRPPESNEIFSRVSFDTEGRISSVTGDTAPLICIVTMPAPVQSK